MLQGTPEWHEFRLKGVGGSDIPSLLSICPYGGSPNKLWLVKTRRSKGFEGNSATRHGKDTEAKARARYELLNLEDMPEAVAVHPKYDMCRVSLDGIRDDRRLILEIKCPVSRKLIDSVIAGKVPEYYMAQVQYQLAVTGADACDFFVYHEASGDDHCTLVLPDLAKQAAIIVSVVDFWNKYVIPDIPPPLTEDDVKVIETDEIKDLCSYFTSEQKISKKEADALKKHIIELAGHPKMRCGSVQISTVYKGNGEFSYHRLTLAKGEK